jgi:hypothetical protein
MPNKTELRLSGTQFMSNPTPQPERFWYTFINSIAYQNNWPSTYFRDPSIDRFTPNPNVPGFGCGVCRFRKRSCGSRCALCVGSDHAKTVPLIRVLQRSMMLVRRVLVGRRVAASRSDGCGTSDGVNSIVVTLRRFRRWRATRTHGRPNPQAGHPSSSGVLDADARLHGGPAAGSPSGSACACSPWQDAFPAAARRLRLRLARTGPGPARSRPRSPASRSARQAHQAGRLHDPEGSKPRTMGPRPPGATAGQPARPHTEIKPQLTFQAITTRMRKIEAIVQFSPALGTPRPPRTGNSPEHSSGEQTVRRRLQTSRRTNRDKSAI